MKLTVTAPDPRATKDFRFLWGKFVRGFDPSVHCARCLIGSYSQVVRVGIAPGEHQLDLPAAPFDYFYLCGVTPKWSTNLHLAVRPKAGAQARVTAHNGVEFLIEDAEAIEIVPLPIGHLGRGPQFTTCRNWQFGLQQYGG